MERSATFGVCVPALAVLALLGCLAEPGRISRVSDDTAAADAAVEVQPEVRSADVGDAFADPAPPDWLADTAGDAPAADTAADPDAVAPDTALDAPPPDLPPAPCGSGTCEPGIGETVKTCPLDCCVCGDCKCHTMECAETVETCPTDCEACGDGKVNPGESPICCPLDACQSEFGSGCGDAVCKGKQCDESPASCPTDCGTPCGNGVCENGENPQICPEDCLMEVCGNGTCDFDESPAACPQDCGAGCGNCKCDGGEDYMSCPVDCGYCGDGICSQCVRESIESCPKDCA